MRRAIVSAALLFLPVVSALSTDEFERFFTPVVMRIDLYHAGTKGEETFSLDRVMTEGEWPGSRTVLVDELNLGEYLASVIDLSTARTIYSRGYSTVFNEWQTTDEAAAGIRRTFSESIRIPFPKGRFQLRISRRDRKMVFQQVLSTVIDPGSPVEVRRERRTRLFPVTALAENGPVQEKVDILILGDGYAKGDMQKFRDDARHLNGVMFRQEPFTSRVRDFNVRMIEVESAESGIDVPDRNVWKNTALGCAYNTFGSARYVLTEENKALRDIAGSAPYDFLCILVNDSRYGGGGIYNLYATTYTGEQNRSQAWQADYMYVHEFGHSFGGLGDEYYTSSVAYNEFYPRGVEPWEPNLTSLTDRKNVRWALHVTEGIPIPTPWEKDRFDSLQALHMKLDRLAPDYYEKREPLYRAEMALLKESPLRGKVGAFEGAGYSSTGLYRPSLDCIMFSLALTPFDPVCAAAIERVIDAYSR